MKRRGYEGLEHYLRLYTSPWVVLVLVAALVLGGYFGWRSWGKYEGRDSMGVAALMGCV